MNFIRTAAVALAPIALLAAVGCSDDPSGSEPGEVSAQDVRDRAGKAVDSATDFAQSTVEDYKQAMRDRVDALNEDIQSLEGRIDELSADAKSEAQDAVDALRAQRDSFANRIDELSAQSASAWSDLKSGIDDAWTELNDAREAAMNKFGG